MRKSRAVVGALAASALCGCVTWGDIDAGVASLKGHPIDYAIERLGLPDSEQVIAGRKVYTWGTRATLPGYSVPSTTSGTVGGKWVATTTTQHVPATQLYCTLKLAVDSSEVVTHAQYNGNLGACERYAKLDDES